MSEVSLWPETSVLVCLKESPVCQGLPRSLPGTESICIQSGWFTQPENRALTTSKPTAKRACTAHGGGCVQPGILGLLPTPPQTVSGS